MPAGGKLAKNGALHYTACGMEDQVVEMDAVARKVARRFSVAEDAEGPVDTTAAKPDGPYMEGRVLAPTCAATSTEASPRANRLWVTCNRNASILEISTDKWALVRKIDTGHGPYALAVTPDGKQLIVALRQGAALEFFDAGSGKSRAKVPTSASAAQSVVVAPDGRYAFVTAAGDGTTGALDVFDVSSHQRVATVALPGKPGVVVFWKAEP
jgi:DNA-binding beta-propeller fold protein YncE